MISTATYSGLWDHIRSYHGSARLFYFLHMTDSANNDFYFSDYNVQLDNYVPANISVNPVKHVASLFDGIFSNSPVKVRITNVQRPQRTNITKRFSEELYNKDFETTVARIYLGYDGIASASDLFPFLIGRCVNFKYGVLSIEFDIVDESLVSLPQIPINRITRANYDEVDPEMIGKPVPVVYGRWKRAAGNFSPHGTWVPAYVVENNLDASTPELVIETTDHAIDAVYAVGVYEEALNAVGILQDTTANSANLNQITITPNSADAADFLTTNIYLYPEKGINYPIGAGNQTNLLDFSTDTYEEMNGSGEAIACYFPDSDGFDAEELEPIYADTTGESTIGIESVVVEVSGYSNETWQSGDTLQIQILSNVGNRTLTELDYTQVNALSDPITFNITSDNLQLTHGKDWSGAEVAFQLDENTGANLVNITPDSGYYFTMEDMARELEKQLNEAGVGILNTYRVSYIKKGNHFRVQRVGGSANFRIKRTGTNSDDLGFTSTSGSYSTTYYDAEDQTVVDVPDGDFASLKVGVKNNSGDTARKFRLKGVRLKIVRKYRDYNIVRAVDRYRTLQEADAHGGGRGGQLDVRTVFYHNAKTGPDIDRRLSIRDEFATGRFFVSLDGRPDDSTSYWNTGPEIIESILSDNIGVAASYVDATKFAAAVSATQVSAMVLYLADLSNARQTLADIARYSLGFLWVTQAGKFAMTCVKASYSSSDVNHTLYARDITAPMADNLRVGRTTINETANDLTLHYDYNWFDDGYGSSLNKTTTQPASLKRREMFCPYINDDTNAATVAEYFCGDTDNYGQWGRFRAVVEFTTHNAEWHFAELGDIVQAHTSFDSILDIHGRDFSTVYFMVVGKQYSARTLTLTLLEVGDTSGGTTAGTEEGGAAAAPTTTDTTYWDDIDLGGVQSD